MIILVKYLCHKPLVLYTAHWQFSHENVFFAIIEYCFNIYHSTYSIVSSILNHELWVCIRYYIIEGLFTILLETGLMLQIMHQNDYCVLDVSLLIQTSLFSALPPCFYTIDPKFLWGGIWVFLALIGRFFFNLFVRPP